MSNVEQEVRELLGFMRATHKECVDLRDPQPDVRKRYMKSQLKDWRCDLCQRIDAISQPPHQLTQSRQENKRG